MNKDMQLSPGQGDGHDRHPEKQNGRANDGRGDAQATLAAVSAGDLPNAEVSMLRAVAGHIDGPSADSLYEIDAATIVGSLAEQGYRLDPDRAEQYLRELRTFAELVGSENDAPALSENMRQRELAIQDAAESAAMDAGADATDTNCPIYDDPERLLTCIKYDPNQEGYTAPRERWADMLQEYVTTAVTEHVVAPHERRLRLGFDPTTAPEDKSDIMPTDETVRLVTDSGESRGQVNKAVLWLYGVVIEDPEIALAARNVLSNHRRRLTNWAVAFPAMDIGPAEDEPGDVGAYTGYGLNKSIDEALIALSPLVETIRSDEDATRSATAAIIAESDPRIDSRDAGANVRPIDAKVYLDLIERVGTDHLDDQLPLDDSTWDERQRAVAAYIRF